MIRWSRVRLVLSIVFAAGLWKTWLERFKYAPPAEAPKSTSSPDSPTYHDYSAAAHIHSTYSDGTGTISEIAASASRAGLDLVLMCDHNSLEAITDGEQAWQSGVLMVIGSEVTTDQGHLLAFDVPTSAMPLPSEAMAAQEAIERAGGYGFIALPCDLKGHWKDFGKHRPGTGLEVFNLSSIARTKINVPAFLLALARYRSRNPVSAFSLIAARPDSELRLWDDLLLEAAQRSESLPVAIGCLDAHAVMRIARQEYPYPTYEEVFRTLRTHILTDNALERTAESAAGDIAQVHAAMRRGRAYVAYDNFAPASGFRFDLTVGGCHAASMGETVSANFNAGEEPVLIVRSPQARTILRLYRNGRLVRAVRGMSAAFTVTAPGVYRIEAYLYKFRVGPFCLASRPWVFSNAINVVAAQ